MTTLRVLVSGRCSTSDSYHDNIIEGVSVSVGKGMLAVVRECTQGYLAGCACAFATALSRIVHV